MKKLVAYYSRADENYFGGTKKYIEVGNTEKAAKMIADMIGADLYKIKQIHPYSADYDTCVKEAKDDLRKNVRPELKNMLESIDEYDEIYLGYPNYWGTMPMLSILSWKVLIGIVRKSIRFVHMKDQDSLLLNQTSVNMQK